MKKILLWIIPVFLFISACGGSGGSSSPDTEEPGAEDPTTRTIGGIVTDPAISGAVVELRLKSDDSVAVICGNTGTLICRAFTDGSGEFDMIIPHGQDLSAYYIKSFGGVDTVTNVDMESFSFETPLEVYADAEESIVVSPITTIMRASTDTTVDGMKAHARSVLGLSDETDPAVDPASVTELFKRSYMLVSMAATYREMANAAGSTADEPFAVIRQATLSGTIFTAEKILEEGTVEMIFHVFSDSDVYDSNLEELQAAAETIRDADTDSGAVAGVINSEIRRMFKTAVMSLAEDTPETVSDTFITNVTAYADAIISAGEGLPADRFVINQIVRYTMLNDYSLASYADFTADTFADSLAALGESETFAIDIEAVLTTGPTYVVSVPLEKADLPGDDNAKRVAYYYNSNIDLGYKARKLASEIRDDDLNDEMNLTAILNYCKGGQFIKAKSMADSLLVKTINQAIAYRYMARYNTSSGGDLAVSVEYLEKAETLIKTVHDASGAEPFTSDEISELILIIQEYEKAEDTESSEALEAYVASEIDTLDADYKATVAGRFVSAMRNIVRDMVEAGESGIEAATDELVEYIEAQEPSDRPGRRYSSHLVYYRYVMEYYQAAGASAKIVSVYENNIKPKVEAEVAEDGTQWQSYVSRMTGPLYWAGEQEEALALQSSFTGSAVNYSAESIVKEMYKGDFDTAVGFYESAVPLVIYGDISDYLDTWTYLGSNYGNPGIALFAIEDGESDLAEMAVDYAVGKMDLIVDSLTQAEGDFASVLVYMVSGSNRYDERGYTKSARLYNDLGLTEKAMASIEKAVSYADACVDSVNKATAYSTIAHFALKIDPDYDAEALYAKSIKVFNNVAGDENFTDENLSDIKYGIAEDYLDQGDTDSAATELAIAVAYAQSIHSASSGEDDEAKDETSALNKHALLYGRLLMPDKARETLEKAIVSASAIESANSKQTYLRYVMARYAELGMFELAYEKAQILFPVRGDYIEGMVSFIDAIQSLDDFEDEDVAFRDMDQDGKPDFFAPEATEEEIEESGLELDDDTDGDGKLDINDTTPFYAD